MESRRWHQKIEYVMRNDAPDPEITYSMILPKQKLWCEIEARGGCQTKCCKNWQRPSPLLLFQFQDCPLFRDVCKMLYFTNVRGKQMTLVTTLCKPGHPADKSVLLRNLFLSTAAHLANELETWNKQLSGIFSQQGRNEINTCFGIFSLST